MQNCSFITSSPVNITCSVFGYYPHVTLQFWHKSAEVPTLLFKEWNNTDWTKNKAITTTAVSSDDPYVCIASDIPGYSEIEKMSIIFITEWSTTDSISIPIPTTTTATSESPARYLRKFKSYSEIHVHNQLALIR